jgi:hypothetical protein
MNHPQGELVLAAASGSSGGLGLIGTLLAADVMYVRCPNDSFGRTDLIDWRVSCNKSHTVQLYRARSIVDAPTVTLASMADGETGPLLNGLTYTAEDTAGSAAWASRKYYTGGADDTADAVQLAALINADNTITPNGSVSVGDTITVVTTDDAGGSNTYTYTAAASPSYTTRVFDQSGNQAAELASIVLALNHKRNVTLSTCLAGTTITFVTENGIRKTYTAHASTTTAASREFSIGGTNSQDGDELVTCLNDATYGLGAGYTAVNAAGVVSITRNYAKAPDIIISSSSATTAACVNTAGGVPGVVAAATGATGELAITPTWVKTLTVTTSNGTRLATTDIDCPGVYATSALGVVTLVPRTPGSPSGGEKATTIKAKTGTGAGHCAVAQTATLLGLVKDGTAWTGVADNSTTSGTIYTQSANGWDHCYLAVTNNDGSNAATVVVAATKY